MEILRTSRPKVVALSPEGLGVVVPEHPETARQMFAAHPDVMAAVDGPMFGYCPGQPHNYATYQCGKVDYLLQDTRSGVNLPAKPGNEGKGITVSLVGNRLVGSRGASPAPSAIAAVQLYPALVIEGRAVEGLSDTDRTGRVAVGILRDGRLGFAYTAASMPDFAALLASAGFVWAGYTDGGGSSSLVTREDGMLRGTDTDDPDGRRVPSWIVWREPDRWLLSGDAKLFGMVIPAASLASGVLALVLLAILAIYLWRRKH